MDKVEGTVSCTVTVCAAIVLSVFLIAGSQCTKEDNEGKWEIRKAAMERKDNTIIVSDWP